MFDLMNLTKFNSCGEIPKAMPPWAQCSNDASLTRPDNTRVFLIGIEISPLSSRDPNLKALHYDDATGGNHEGQTALLPTMDTAKPWSHLDHLTRVKH